MNSCCPNPNIQRMDSMGHINRMCLKCGAHWYAKPDEEVKQYSRREWDELMNAAEDCS